MLRARPDQQVLQEPVYQVRRGQQALLESMGLMVLMGTLGHLERQDPPDPPVQLARQVPPESLDPLDLWDPPDPLAQWVQRDLTG